MIKKYSPFIQNGNKKPVNLINSALKELGVNCKFKNYEVDNLFVEEYKKSNLEDCIVPFMVGDKEVVLECVVKELYLDDENNERVSGHFFEITKITYEGKSIGVEIAV